MKNNSKYYFFPINGCQHIANPHLTKQPQFPIENQTQLIFSDISNASNFQSEFRKVDQPAKKPDIY